MKRNIALVTIIIAATTAVSHAQPAVEWTGGNYYTMDAAPGTFGWRFRVTSASDVQVYALGALNGSQETNTVGIWNISGGAPLATATIPPSDGVFVEGHFRYVNIQPVRLFKDTEYVIGCTAGRLAYSVVGLTNSPSVQWLIARMVQPSAGLAFPTGEDGALGVAAFGPNFQLSPVPSVPHASIRLSQVEVCWTSETNKNYTVEYQSALTTNAWLYLAGPIQGTGTNNCVQDAIRPGEPQRFYRILGVPIP